MRTYIIVICALLLASLVMIVVFTFLNREKLESSSSLPKRYFAYYFQEGTQDIVIGDDLSDGSCCLNKLVDTDFRADLYPTCISWLSGDTIFVNTHSPCSSSIAEYATNLVKLRLKLKTKYVILGVPLMDWDAGILKAFKEFNDTISDSGMKLIAVYLADEPLINGSIVQTTNNAKLFRSSDFTKDLTDVKLIVAVAAPSLDPDNHSACEAFFRGIKDYGPLWIGFDKYPISCPDPLLLPACKDGKCVTCVSPLNEESGDKGGEFNREISAWIRYQSKIQTLAIEVNAQVFVIPALQDYIPQNWEVSTAPQDCCHPHNTSSTSILPGYDLYSTKATSAGRYSAQVRATMWNKIIYNYTMNHYNGTAGGSITLILPFIPSYKAYAYTGPKNKDKKNPKCLQTIMKCCLNRRFLQAWKKAVDTDDYSNPTTSVCEENPEDGPDPCSGDDFDANIQPVAREPGVLGGGFSYCQKFGTPCSKYYDGNWGYGLDMTAEVGRCNTFFPDLSSTTDYACGYSWDSASNSFNVQDGQSQNNMTCCKFTGT